MHSRLSQNLPWPTSFCRCQVDQRATHLSMAVWFPTHVGTILLTHRLYTCQLLVSLCWCKVDLAKSWLLQIHLEVVRHPQRQHYCFFEQSLRIFQFYFSAVNEAGHVIVWPWCCSAIFYNWRSNGTFIEIQRFLTSIHAYQQCHPSARLSQN